MYRLVDNCLIKLMINFNSFFSQSHLPSLKIPLTSSCHPPSPNCVMPRPSSPMNKPTTGTSKNKSYQTNSLIAWNSILSLETRYVLQWLKVWWAWRHAIITCPMLLMPYPSLLRQPQSQANAGKSKCGGVWYLLVFLEYFIFFHMIGKNADDSPFPPVLESQTRASLWKRNK